MTGCTATGNGGHGISARTSSATITGCYSWGNLWNSLIISHPEVCCSHRTVTQEGRISPEEEGSLCRNGVSI
jgi:hypothetical protein